MTNWVHKLLTAVQPLYGLFETTLILFIFGRDKFGRYHDFWLEFGPVVPDFDKIWATILFLAFP